MTLWAYVNDSFVKDEEAAVSVHDLSVQRGYGIFEFFRLHGSQPLFLEEHLDRFTFSADGMRLALPLSRSELRTILEALIQRNQLPDSGIRLTLTGGISANGADISSPCFLITQQTFSQPSTQQYTQGIELVSYEHQRQLPHIKTIDYLMAVWLQPWIRQCGAIDVLYHNRGMVTECPRSNFFLITRAGRMLTARDNVLKGITREKVLQLAATCLEVEEGAVSMDDVRMADAAFVTSTTRGILPVRRVDNRLLDSRHPAIILLMERWNQLLAGQIRM